MADVNRLRIVRRLADGDATVTELIDHVGLSQPLVSWHLARLRAAGSSRPGARVARPSAACARRPSTSSPRANAPPSGSPASPDDHLATTPATRIKKVFEPIALGMGRLGLTPNGLTLIGFGITVVGALLARRPAWLIGGLVVFVGGVFDMFDGTLARATGKVSPLGAFMDSVFDRWGEAIVYLGIVVGGARAGSDAVAILAAAATGRRVHGQLHPGQVRGPRLHRRDRHGRRSGSCPARSGSSS